MWTIQSDISEKVSWASWTTDSADVITERQDDDSEVAPTVTNSDIQLNENNEIPCAQSRFSDENNESDEPNQAITFFDMPLSPLVPESSQSENEDNFQKVSTPNQNVLKELKTVVYMDITNIFYCVVVLYFISKSSQMCTKNLAE